MNLDNFNNQIQKELSEVSLERGKINDNKSNENKNQDFQNDIFSQKQFSDKITLDEQSNIPIEERSYHLNVVLKLVFMSAMGGFLFGYDTGVVGAANLYLHMTFEEISNTDKERIVSVALLASALGSIIAGPLSDIYGRKMIIMISDLLFIFGSTLLFLAPSINGLLIGRVIVGLGVGSSAMIVPIYLAELSPNSIRGGMVSFNTVFITLGQTLAYLFALAFVPYWRLMFGFGVFPALLQLIAMLVTPESPKYLMKIKENEKATIIFSTIFDVNKDKGRAEMQKEIKEIEEELAEITNKSCGENLKELFTVYRKIIFVGVMLQVWQQVGGINTAMYYGPEMMKQAGFGDENDEKTTLYASIPLSVINLIGTSIAFYFIDKLGRRYMMLKSLPGCALGMFSLAVALWIHSSKDPNIEELGKWLSFQSIFLYLACFAVGMNATPWTVNSEIYPLHLRGLGDSIATTANWLSNYLVSSIFLSVTDSIEGEVITYFVLGILNVCAFIFIYKMLPETKGKSLAEIIELFVPKKKRELERNGSFYREV